jgi:hypothetical protein
VGSLLALVASFYMHGDADVRATVQGVAVLDLDIITLLRLCWLPLLALLGRVFIGLPASMAKLHPLWSTVLPSMRNVNPVIYFLWCYASLLHGGRTPIFLGREGTPARRYDLLVSFLVVAF